MKLNIPSNNHCAVVLLLLALSLLLILANGVSEQPQPEPLVPASATAREIDAQKVKQCVNDKIGDKKYRKSPVNPTFSMHFGDQSVEVFNVLGQLQLKQIEFLQACVREQDESYFLNRDASANQWLHYGGSNVTYITGILQRVFPEIEAKIYDALKLGIEEAEWHLSGVHAHKLGIRSIEYLSCTGDQPRITMRDIQRRRAVADQKKEAAKGMVYIGRDEAVDKAHGEFVNHNNDEAVAAYLNSIPHTVLTGHIAMSDVDTYVGGEVLIQRSLGGADSSADDGYEPEDEEIYSDEDELKVEQLTDSIPKPPPVVAPPKPSLKGALTTKTNTENAGNDNSNTPATTEDAESPKKTYSAVNSKIHKFSPDRGGMIFVLGSALQGMKPVIKGHRYGLRIEFWAYADAPLSNTIASVQNAKPLLDKEL